MSNNNWNPMMYSDNAPQGFNDSIVDAWANNAVAAFSPDAPNYFTFDQSALTPSWAQMGNWGGPATTWSGKLQEGWNGLTNNASNAWGSAANSTFGKQLGEMPMMDKLKGIAGIIGAVGGVMQGRNQMKLMERSLNQQRDQWNKSWGASTKQYNSEIEDRQRSRVASNPNAYQSVDSYMNKNRIS